MNLGLGYSEILLILIVVLVVIGPRKLPEILRTMGKLMRELRKASDELRRELLFSDEINSVKRTLRDGLDPVSPPPIPPRLRTKKDGPPQDRPNSSQAEPSAQSGELEPSPEPLEPK